MLSLPQLIPQDFCLKCQGCCRFREESSIWQPAAIDKLIPYQDFFICPEFDFEKNRCKNYEKRPLDCQLYPFLLHRKDGNIFLALDKKCPFVETLISANKTCELPLIKDNKFNLYIQEILSYLNQPQIKNTIKETPRLINDYGEDTLVPPSRWNGVSRLTLKDKPLVDKYMNFKKHNLAVYSFANIFIWSGLFDIFYKVIGDSLCIFFKDKIGIFMYTALLGKKITPAIIDEVFNIMNNVNENKEISRIENIEEGEVDFYRQAGLDCRQKFSDYIYRIKDIAVFSGNKFKSQRSSLNFFMKNYSSGAVYQPYTRKTQRGCVELLNNWVNLRKGNSKDRIFNACLDDSMACQKIALENFGKIGLIGRVVKIKQKICAFSFLYKLNKDTICVLFETTDLNIKGLSQFIFSKVAQEFWGFQFVNCLDDSGFENIKRHKLLYHPHKLEPSFIAKR